MDEEDKVVGGGSTSAAEIIEKVTQLQTSYEGQVQQLQGQVRNLKQYIKDLEETHAAELAKYAVKSDVDSSLTLGSSKLTETMEEVRITDPLKIPEVIEMILNNLEVESMREVRSVCKLWNETWVRIKSKEPSYEKLHGDTIVKLHSLLNKSSAPEAIIQNILCCGSYGDHSKSEENLQKLLKAFGDKVKKFWIRQEKREFSPIKSILMDCGEWCQNLEALKVTMAGEAGIFKDFILKKGQMSRLKRLTFHSVCTDDDNEESRIPEDKHLFSMLIKASPNLECLTMGLKSHSFCLKGEKVVAECVNALTAYPKVTRNLKEFQIRGNWTPKFNPFRNLLEVQFSSVLKRLTLQWRCHINPNLMPKEEIAELLKKIGGSLESLTLRGGSYSHMNAGGFDWPILPRLKILKNYAQEELQLELLELKSRMPILEKLVLAGKWFSNLIDKRCLNKLFDIEGTHRTFHHLNLKDLTIFGKIYSSKTPAMINRMFPNISKLTIYIYPHKFDLMRQPGWFHEALEGLSQMHKITHLTFRLRNCFKEDQPSENTNTAFEKLQNLPDLRFLTLISDSTDPVRYSFQDLVMKLLSSCEGLKCLNLIGYTGTFKSIAELIEAKDPDTQLKLNDGHELLTHYL